MSERLLMYFLPHRVARDAEGSHFLLCNTRFILREDGELVSIEALNKGQGDGTQCLNLICHTADLYGVTLTVYARAHDHRPHSTVRAIRWYERHGFKITGDNGLDWSALPSTIDEDHAGCDLERRTTL